MTTVTQPKSYEQYAELQRSYNEVPTPDKWWGQWCSEQDRSWFMSRLQPKDAAQTHSYGLAKTWKLIPSGIQSMLVKI